MHQKQTLKKNDDNDDNDDNEGDGVIWVPYTSHKPFRIKVFTWCIYFIIYILFILTSFSLTI